MPLLSIVLCGVLLQCAPKQSGIICPQDEEHPYADCFPDQERIDNWLRTEAEKQGIDWIIAKAVLIKESHYGPANVSSTGAVGLMQLMPRRGSHTTPAYEAFMKARRQPRAADGLRYHAGKSAPDWGRIYQRELIDLHEKHRLSPQLMEELYSIDTRFNPQWNIQSGVRQLAGDYKYFYNRHKSEYVSVAYAACAYNAGRSAVAVDKNQPRHDRIPVNRETEHYVSAVLRIYLALKEGNGRIPRERARVLFL
ncbi:MAG: transglycosylase SLT domain-containing protein [Leptospiraceae bacterium]|nr:transglycosylase SLT domain-containing protein [Leptospiraceae bacterium]